MSRIGLKPISIPDSVTAQVEDNQIVVKGAKGELNIPIPQHISVNVNQSTITVSRDSDEKKVRALHGLVRSLINNGATGVKMGYRKQLEVTGVGYKVQASGHTLKLSLGYSHDITYTIPANVTVTVEQNVITIEGIDKQIVGQVAAEIREYKKPEPYKGKGIRYIDEYVIRKSGKAASGGKE